MSYDGPSEDTSALLNLGVVIPSSSERRDDAYTSKSHLLQDTGLCHSSTVFFLMTGMGHVAENCFRSQVDSYDESLLRKTSGRTGRLFPLDRSFSQDYMGSHHEAKRNKLYLLAPSPHIYFAAQQLGLPSNLCHCIQNLLHNSPIMLLRHLLGGVWKWAWGRFRVRKARITHSWLILVWKTELGSGGWAQQG